jgi:hypothetical protein
VVVRAEDIPNLPPCSDMPDRIEMLTLAIGLLLQGKDRYLERIVRSDFITGCIELFVRGKTVRGLRRGKVSVDVTLVDDDGNPIHDKEAAQ